MADHRLWFRLELRPDGEVAACRQVEGPEKNGARVFYLRASDRDDAIRAAANLHQRIVQRARRAKLVGEGKCPWCAQKQDRGPGLRCSACAATRAKEHERRTEREESERRGAPPPPMVRSNSRKIRHEILTEVREAWREAGSNAAFTRWLDAEIGKALERVGLPATSAMRKTGS